MVRLVGAAPVSHLAVEEVLEQLLDLRDAGGAADQHHLVHRRLRSNIFELLSSARQMDMVRYGYHIHRAGTVICLYRFSADAQLHV